ncbi:MAG: hypothetical protein AB7I09_20750, partial [Planctomycetota bacterium]
ELEEAVDRGLEHVESGSASAGCDESALRLCDSWMVRGVCGRRESDDAIGRSAREIVVGSHEAERHA